MQVTITLNHLIILIICLIMLVIVLYILQIYKKISKELSAISSIISPFQNRITSIAKQQETITLNVQHLNSIWTERTRKGKCCSQYKDLT
jgi:uncharacterized protein YoxC